MKGLRTLVLAAIIPAAAGLNSCGMNCMNGNGVEATENRDLDEFSAIDLGGSYKLVLTRDSLQSLRISADENLMPHIKTEVRNNRLRVYSEDNICDEVVIVISMKELKELEASGAVEVEMTNRFVTDEFNLEVSGAVEADLNVEAQKIRTELSGAGEIEYEGKAGDHRVSISGAGELRAENLVVNRYDLDLSGAAECSVHVLEELNVEGSGASSVVYRGNPSKINQDLSGAGSIRQAAD